MTTFRAGKPGFTKLKGHELLQADAWRYSSVVCPLFRFHGVREPGPLVGSNQTGGSDEVWSFGDKAYEIIREELAVRERLRPYMMEQTATATGMPVMSRLFFEFPDEPPSWELSDKYMFGPDLLLAPVTPHGARERDVYLPEWASWLDARTGQPLDGSGWIKAPAPLSRKPVYLRQGASLTTLANKPGQL